MTESDKPVGLVTGIHKIKSMREGRREAERGCVCRVEIINPSIWSPKVIRGRTRSLIELTN